MAILKGFPPSNTISTGGPRTPQNDFEFRIKEEKPLLSGSCVFVHIGPNDFSQPAEVVPPCPKLYKMLDKQYERVRAAHVVYTTDDLEQRGIEPTPEIMKTCLDVGEEMYELYAFDRHGPYTEYIEGHLRRAVLEKDYALKVVSRSYFG